MIEERTTLVKLGEDVRAGDLLTVDANGMARKAHPGALNIIGMATEDARLRDTIHTWISKHVQGTFNPTTAQRNWVHRNFSKPKTPIEELLDSARELYRREDEVQAG